MHVEWSYKKVDLAIQFSVADSTGSATLEKSKSENRQVNNKRESKFSKLQQHSESHSPFLVTTMRTIFVTVFKLKIDYDFNLFVKNIGDYINKFGITSTMRFVGKVKRIIY